MNADQQIKQAILTYKEKNPCDNKDIFATVHPSVFKGKVSAIDEVDVIETALMPNFTFIIMPKPVSEVLTDPLLIDYLKPDRW